MKNPIFSGMVAVILSAAAAHAQSSEAATSPSEAPLDLEARKASVAQLEIYIAQRETRLAELGKDIVALDARIEKRVDELVKMLADMRDSKDSKMRVSQIKQEAIEGLRKGIQIYSAKRREMTEKAKAGDEGALGDLGKFDERIFKRVDQIVEIGRSFPTHKDVDKYQSEGGSYWNGYYYENTRISDDWKQNRRDKVQGGKTRDEVSKALREGLERLDQRRRSLKDLLDNRSPSESARELYVREIGEIDARTEHLNAELVLLTSGGDTGATNAPGLNEAMDIENMLEDARKDLREDVSNLFRLYDQFSASRSKLSELKENIVARKAWLEKNAPAAK